MLYFNSDKYFEDVNEDVHDEDVRGVSPWARPSTYYSRRDAFSVPYWFFFKGNIVV